jgi:hypothetical protein
LYGGDETSEYEELAVIETWARFQIHPSVDILDDWKIYLIDSPPKARIVYSFCEGNIVEFNLAAGSFDGVVAIDHHSSNLIVGVGKSSALAEAFPLENRFQRDIFLKYVKCD